VISTSTAAELLEVMREVLGLGRLTRQTAEAGAGGEPNSYALHVAKAQLLGLLDAAGEQRLGMLAGPLDIDASVVSRRVAALEDAGLVARRPDPEDRRAQLVALTERGRAMLLAHRNRQAEQVAYALAHRSDAEICRLVAELRGLVADLQQVSPTHRRRAGPVTAR
jgi:DNA-binding MarR family transcriptional regulator